jgi:hypothetical protein
MVGYEVVLGPAAKRAVLGLQTEKDREGLADALRQELAAGPNADKEYQFDSVCDEGRIYTATPLSFNGFTSVHRAMAPAELRRLRRELGHPVSRGFYVLDILPPESGVNRRRPPLL